MNAAGTLNLLEAMRQACAEAPLVHLSHQQGLRRRAQSNPDEGIADPLGLRRSIVRGGHHGRFPNRSIKALSIRCLESCWGCPGTGIREGFPVAPLETMACGLPIIITDVPGSADIMGSEDARPGMVVPVGDSAALASALIKP